MSEYLSSFPLVFGFLAAAIHVLAGPDHLAAIAPFALNTRFKPWMIGMSWGIGHLMGMLVIGVLFFFFKELIPVEFISANSEKIVGILLILIGFWAIARLYYFGKRSPHKHAHTHWDESGNSFVHMHDHNHETRNKHTHKQIENQTYLTALGIGIIHGLAGVSHALSMLPTLAFETRFESAMYLVGFGSGTISAMVLFSFLLGLISQYTTQRKKDFVFKAINVVAGFGAIFVGFVWLWNTW